MERPALPEIRIPLYGTVQLTDLEWAVVNSPPYESSDD
jgi:hypothetical protein